MTGNIVIRKCQTLDEFQLCVALQREIWQEADLEIEPVTAFVVAANTGGQVLGAFEGKRLALADDDATSHRALDALMRKFCGFAL